MTHLSSRRLVASALLLIALISGCNSTGGGGIGVARGFNAVSFPSGQRKAAPSFGGATLRSGSFSSVSLRETVAVVNFWGTWCGPCRREQPFLQKLFRELAGRGVAFVGVNARRDQRAAALAYLDEFHVTYPSVYNPDSSIAFRFRVRFMPATFVIDRQGRIAAEVIGALESEKQLRDLIDGASS
jgi:thiol-disulfide isomerase/thioredoxin